MKIKFQYIFFDQFDDNVVVCIDLQGNEHRFQFDEVPMSLRTMLILHKVMNGESIPNKYKLYEERVRELLPVEWELVNGVLYDADNEAVRKHKENMKSIEDSWLVDGEINVIQ